MSTDLTSYNSAVAPAGRKAFLKIGPESARRNGDWVSRVESQQMIFPNGASSSALTKTLRDVYAFGLLEKRQEGKFVFDRLTPKGTEMLKTLVSEKPGQALDRVRRALESEPKHSN